MTKDLIQAMLDGAILENPAGYEMWFDEPNSDIPFWYRFKTDKPSPVKPGHWELVGWTIKPEPRRRPMTRWEMLAWACSEEAHGWVVRVDKGEWLLPQAWTYMDLGQYERARITPDGPGEPEAFEVDE